MHIPLPIIKYISVDWLPSIIISFYLIYKRNNLPRYLPAVSIIIIFFAIEKAIVGWSGDGLPYYINLISVETLSIFSLLLPMLIFLSRKKYHFPSFIIILAFIGLFMSLLGYIFSFLISSMTFE